MGLDGEPQPAGRGGEKGDDAKGTDGEQGKGGSQTKSDGKSGKVATVVPA